MTEPPNRSADLGADDPWTPASEPTDAGAGVDVWCTELELSADQPGVLPAGSPGELVVRVLVRLHQVPVGFLTLEPSADRTAEALLTAALAELGDEVDQHLTADGLAVGQGSERRDLIRVPCPRPVLDDHVSVVVGTRNRPEHVEECLQLLKGVDYPAFDVVVVDNAPDTDATREVFDAAVGSDDRFAYLRLAEPGVSRARNAGISAARGPLVAFIDDDVRVDRFWLQALARAFAREPSAACVTGLVATRAIVGPEQRYFDSRVSWAANLSPRVFRPTSDDPLHPWAAGRFGAGANMAFRLAAVRALGGFDEDLGPGTVAKGGEDIDLFVRTLRAGDDLVYEPAALAWHVHRSVSAELEKQMFGYGVGLTAYLAKHALEPAVAWEMARKLAPAVRHVLTVTRAPQRQGVVGPAARRYRRIELSGMVVGPLYYLRSTLGRRLRRAGR